MEKEQQEKMMKKESNFRKKMSRILSLFMAMAVFSSLALVPADSFAASKKKKSKKAKYSIVVYNIKSGTTLAKGTQFRILAVGYKKKGGKVYGTKLKYKSSNKKVASVSKSGVIKAKKKGTAKITVYCKSKPSKKKTIKIKVKKLATSVKVSGHRVLYPGRSCNLKATVNGGSGGVVWASSNTGVATVDGSGRVTGVANGTCTIYARATDGSGAAGSMDIVVHRYSKSEGNWIAHRGMHSASVTENTVSAFQYAAKYGFWGIECDIYETAHTPVEEKMTLPAEVNIAQAQLQTSGLGDDSADSVAPAEDADPEEIKPEETAEGTEADGTQLGIAKAAKVPEDVTAAANAIKALGISSSTSKLTKIDKTSQIEAAMTKYKALDDAGKYAVRQSLGDSTLQAFFDAYYLVESYKSYDLVINHDDTFSRTMGYNVQVKSMTKDQIQSALGSRGVCFLDQYLDICKAGGNVPVVEFKDKYMSTEAMQKAVESVYRKGLLDKAYFISFSPSLLAAARDYAASINGGRAPKSYFLFNSDASSNVTIAANYGFTGVAVKHSILTDAYTRAKNCGLGVGTWTYDDTLSELELLYSHVFNYQLDFVTMDYKNF